MSNSVCIYFVRIIWFYFYLFPIKIFKYGYVSLRPWGPQSENLEFYNWSPPPSSSQVQSVSERSVILINFCLSIICSNALILISQTQSTQQGINRSLKLTVLSSHQLRWQAAHLCFRLSLAGHVCVGGGRYCISSSCPRSVGSWRRRASPTWPVTGRLRNRHHPQALLVVWDGVSVCAAVGQCWGNALQVT